MARNHVEMGVGNRLPGGLAHVDTDGVAVGRRRGLDVAPHGRHKCPHGGLLLRSESQEIWLVPPWDQEAVTWIQRKGVQERPSQVVLGDEVSASQPIAEHAGHGSTRYHAKP